MLEATGRCRVVVRAQLTVGRWISLLRQAAHISMPNAIMANEGMHDLSP
ncbi:MULTISPECIES: hypothetical protein [unclassified Variovorax]|nr:MULTISPECIES: hypothetical protein [unclassified Variovorax]